jgi:hypothetical protein
MNTSQRNFAVGEVSPALYARSDLAAYRTALRTLRNATVKRTGGIQSRPGTERITGTKANQLSRLASIVFDDTDAFVAEFGLHYVRLFKNGAPITVTDAQGAWTTATAYVVGNVVTSINGTALAAYLCIAAHTSGSASEPTTGADWQDYWYELVDQVEGSVGAGPWIFELPTPYAAGDIFDLQVRGYQLNTVPVVHPSHAPRALVRYGTDSQWTFDVIDFGSSGTVPQSVAVSGSSGTGWGYRVTAIVDGVESPALAAVRTNIAADYFDLQNTVFDVLTAANRTVTWTAVSGATKYRVYANPNATFLGFWFLEVTTNSFVDDGTAWPSVVFTDFSAVTGVPGSIITNYPTANPPEAPPVLTTNEFPSVVGAYQQRLLLGGSNLRPDVVEASRTGSPFDFTISDPVEDSSPVSWRQVGPRLNRVRHFVEIAQRLVQFSSIGESIIQGDGDAILVPGAVNPRQVSEYGAARSPEPLVLGDTALFVQARGNQVRDLYAVESTLMGGNELSITAAHLFDGYTVTNWCYQQTPDPTVWVVRSDGVLLSLTYAKANGIFAWARHDLRTSQGSGKFLSVACIPEGGRDTVYAVIEYTRSGPTTTRLIARFADRTVANPVCADAAVEYAVRPGTLTVAGFGGDFFNNAYLYTVTASSSVFSASDNGRVLRVVQNGTWITGIIVGFTSATSVFVWTAGLSQTIADGVIAAGDWVIAQDLAHLAGEPLAVVVDNVVLASPHNTAYAPLTASSITIGPVTRFFLDLPAVYARTVVGLPYTVDVETLDIDAGEQTIKERGLMVGGVDAWVEDTGTFYAGPYAVSGQTNAGLEAVIPRDAEGNALGRGSGYVSSVLLSAYNNTGRVFVRHVDPQPFTLLALITRGHFGGR